MIRKKLYTETFVNESTFATAWLLVCPVTATFQQPLNANCRATCYMQQIPKKSRKKRDETNQQTYNCSKSTVKALEQIIITIQS